MAMDTLASEEGSLKPFKTVTKIIPLLHIRTIICPMGDLQFALSLFNYIELNVICNDYSTLINILKKDMKSFVDQYIDKQHTHGTIYLIGYNPSKSRFEGCVLRLEGNSFKFDDLGYGLIVKPSGGILDPETKQPLIPIKTDQIPDLLYDIVVKMREIDLDREKNEKMGIGGQVQIVTMTKSGYTLETTEMNDYKKTYNEIVDNIRKKKCFSY